MKWVFRITVFALVVACTGIYLQHSNILRNYGTYANKRSIEATLEKKKHHQRDPAYERQWIEEKVGEGNEIPYGLASHWREWDQQNAGRSSDENPFDTIIELGPRSVGGRTRAIHIDPRNSDYMLAGGVSGGIWYSTNTGQSWQVLNDHAANLSVTSLTYNPLNPDIIYYSTGEPRGSGGIGEGIFKSTDNGLHFEQLPSSLDFPDFRYTWKIAHSLTDSNTVFVGSYRGLYRTTDAGASWELVLNISNRDANDILVFNDGSVIVAMEETGLYYSADGSPGSFTQMDTDIFPEHFTRLKLAYAANQQNYIYCMVAVDIGNDNAPLIFKSTNAGSTWIQKATPITSGTQSRYNMMLGVHPNNPNRVICGAVLANYSENGGTSWFFAGVSHSDFHEFIPVPDNPAQFFVGNDGGIFLYRWNEIFNPIDRNNMYNVTQYYGGSHDLADDITIGGTQDNGTVRVSLGTNNYIFGADGGWAHAHQQVDNIAYFSTQNDGLYRSENWKGGIGIPLSISHSPMSAEGVSFINAYEMNYADGDQLYYKTYKGIWRSHNRGNMWEKINEADISNIYRLSLSTESDPSLYFAAASGPGANALYRTSDALTGLNFESFFSITDQEFLSNRSTITTDIHPNNNDRILFAYYNYTGNDDQIWMIENTLASEVSAINVTGNLPNNLPVNSIKFHPYDPDNIFIAGTDFGLYYTCDAGQTWSKEDRIPNVQVRDIRIRQSDGKVFFFTYGRGVWTAQLKLPQPQPRSIPYAQNFNTGNWYNSAFYVRSNNNGRIKVRSGTDSLIDHQLLVLDLSTPTNILTSSSYIERLRLPGDTLLQLTYDGIVLEEAINQNSGVYISYDNGNNFELIRRFSDILPNQWYRDTIQILPPGAGDALLKFEYRGRKEFPHGGVALDNIELGPLVPVIPTVVLQHIIDEIRLYPNPAVDRISMKLPTTLNIDKIRLSDAGGAQLSDWKIGASDQQYLDLPSGISGGIYFLTFYNETGALGSRTIIVN